MPLSARSLRTLDAICDTILPPDPSPWRAGVAARIAGALDRSLPSGDLARLTGLLWLLDTPAGTLALGGRPGRFGALPRRSREAALRALASHPLPPLRGAFQVLKRLAASFYYSDTDDEGRNPVWPALGYPGPLPVAPGDPSPIRPLAVDRDVALACDVVVVGSGAGGGVVAGELASAGFDVVVLEKGALVDAPRFDHREMAAFRRLYLGAGMTTTSDGGLLVLAGSCLGGGTVVNYTTSFRLPDGVRAEWTRVTGLDLFAGPALDASFDAVCRRLGVNAEHNQPSRRDALLARGLEALGWHVGQMPRNVAGCPQDDLCGYCGFGCVRNAKQSMTATYLVDAWANGARFLVECAAEGVLVENGRASGVVARTRTGHRVTVRARHVVTAAGAIHTPALLQRSGVGGPVGDHLRLHPAVPVWGLFRDEVRPWTGTLQARYSDELADLHEGYGIRLETAPAHPAFFALSLPWESGDAFGSLMRQMPWTLPAGVLLRDRFGGRVRLSRQGTPRIEYRLSAYDRRHLLRGIEAAARVLLAAGATGVLTSQRRRVQLEAGEPLEPWMQRVGRTGLGPHDLVCASFHQMGTCRMGRDPAASVTDANGECHRVRDLFVADASLFPTASGVNPMITIAALAHHVARQIKERLS